MATVNPLQQLQQGQKLKIEPIDTEKKLKVSLPPDWSDVGKILTEKAPDQGIVERLNPDPPPPDWNQFLLDTNQLMSPERLRYVGEQIQSIGDQAGRWYQGVGYNSMASFTRGMAGLYTHLDLIAQWGEANLGLSRSGFFKKLADINDNHSAYWRQRANEKGIDFLQEMVSEAVGGAAPGMLQFMLDVKSGLSFPLLAKAQETSLENKELSVLEQEKLKNPYEEGILEAVKTGVLSSLFKMMEPLGAYLRVPVAGTVGAVQAAAEAPEGTKAKEAIKGAFAMGLYSATSPGERLGMNEMIRNAREYYGRPEFGIDSNLFQQVIYDESGFVRMPEIKKSLGSFADAFHQRVFNRGSSIEKLSALAQKKGMELDPIEDPQLRYRGSLGLQGKAQAAIEHGTFYIDREGNVQWNGEGLKPIIKDYAGAWDKLNEQQTIIPSKELLRPAIKVRGKIFKGKPGMTWEEIPREFSGEALETPGFLTPKGDFIQPTAAKYWVQENQPNIYSNWERVNGKDSTLTMNPDDYNNASRHYSGKREELALREFHDYFESTRTLEDLQRPAEAGKENIATPEQVKEAKEKLASLENKYKDLNGFKLVNERIYSYQRRILMSLVNSGNMSMEAFEKIILANPHYVPFRKILDTINATTGQPETPQKPSTGSRFDTAKAKVYRIRGSEKENEDILSSIITSTYLTLDTAERNTVANTVANMIGTPVGEELGIVPIKKPTRSIRVSAEEIKTTYKEFEDKSEEIKRSVTTSSEGVSSATGPVARLETVVLDSLKARGMTGPEAQSALMRIKESAERKGAEKGAATTTVELIDRISTITKNVIKEPEDTTIYRPSELKPEGNVVGYYQDGKLKYMEVPRLLYEAMNAGPAVPEYLRKTLDIASAPARLLRRGVTLTPTYMIRNALRDNITAAIQTSVGFRPLVDPISIVADLHGKTELYYRYLASGAAHSTFVEMSRKQMAIVAKDMIKNPSKYAKLNIIKTASDLSEAIEKSTKLAVYDRAKTKGYSDLEAGLQSAESTVDFRLKGSDVIVQEFSKATAFLNPGLQALDKMYRNFRDNPKDTAIKGLLYVTLPSLITYYMYHDDPEYKEMQTWVKDTTWPIKVSNDPNDSKRWAYAPKPQGLGYVFGSMVERFLDYASENDPEAFKGIMRGTVEALTPITGDPMGAIFPTTLKPLLENAYNYDFFKEAPVTNQDKMDTRLEELQYGRYASETAKYLGLKLGYSPDKIDHLIRGYTGGTGQYGVKALDEMIRAFQSDPKGQRPTEWADYPVFDAFFKKPVEATPKSLTRFYSDAAEIEKSYNTYLDYLKENKLKDAARIAEKYPTLELAPTTRRIKQSLSYIGKQIDIITESDLPDEIKKEGIAKGEKIRMEIGILSEKLLKGTLTPEETEELQTIVNENKE